MIGCPKCNGKMRKVEVKIQDSKSPVTSYQCSECGYFDFDEKLMNKAINEIKKKKPES